MVNKTTSLRKASRDRSSIITVTDTQRNIDAHLLLVFALLGFLSTLLLLTLALLEQSLRYQDLILGRDGPLAIVWLRAKNCGTVVCWLSCILR